VSWANFTLPAFLWKVHLGIEAKNYTVRALRQRVASAVLQQLYLRRPFSWLAGHYVYYRVHKPLILPSTPMPDVLGGSVSNVRECVAHKIDRRATW
jgi:hypothetical protein